MAQDSFPGMSVDALKDWRKSERARLIAARVALDVAQRLALREAIGAHLERAFPQLAASIIAFCWPYRNEYDARHWLHRLRASGAHTLLPVVVGSGRPLIFRT